MPGWSLGRANQDVLTQDNGEAESYISPSQLMRMPKIIGVSVGLTCGYYFAVGQRACDYLPRSVVGGGVQPRAGLDTGVCTYSDF